MMEHMTMRMNSCCICMAKKARSDVLRLRCRPLMIDFKTNPDRPKIKETESFRQEICYEFESVFCVMLLKEFKSTSLHSTRHLIDA